MPDRRAIILMQMEEEIQKRAKRKDAKFVLSGRWKKFVREQDGFMIYAVNGEWVRSNLSVIFGHGGHGLVHEFIPLDEIWVATRHFNGDRFNSCGCDNLKRSNQKVSQRYFDSTVVHETKEFNEMADDTPFTIAHDNALLAEKEAGILEDPHTEVDTDDERKDEKR